MRQSWIDAVLMTAVSILFAGQLFAQDADHGLHDRNGNPDRPASHSIVSITVCTPGASGSPGSCPSGTVDTAKAVLAPSGGILNEYGGLAAAVDEHSTIFPPGTIPRHPDYLFWLASQTALGSSLGTDLSGLVVLSGGPGPDSSGQWTLDYAPNFGRYAPQNPQGQQNGQIFLSAMAHLRCPPSPDQTKQDATYDLNYADPGTVFFDPTTHGQPGRILMLYEGTNRCIGDKGGSNDGNNFYSTLGVATSLDYGHTWPTYRNNWVVPLPAQNSSAGPNAPLGAFGSGVCFGNDCSTVPPADYGRYAVLSPHMTVSDFMGLGAKLTNSLGDSEPSAFVDDVRGDGEAPGRYVYVVNSYHPPDGTSAGLTVARALLNGGTAPLQFMKWNGASFSEPGLGPAGGVSALIFPIDDTRYQNCLANQQNISSGAISYVEETQQYLLTFICTSPNDPATQQGTKKGSAWFYSTLDANQYDLSNQNQWSAPQEIIGSWQEFVVQPTGPDKTCNASAWYPSFMSLHHAPGHLSTTGYVFFLHGCLDSVPNRTFSTRIFTIMTR